MENINKEENEENRTMRLRFEETLHTLKASTKENIEAKERQMKQKKGIAKAEIGRANQILEKHLGNTKQYMYCNTCSIWYVPNN